MLRKNYNNKFKSEEKLNCKNINIFVMCCWQLKALSVFTLLKYDKTHLYISNKYHCDYD